MALYTRLTEMLGIEYPIISAPMACPLSPAGGGADRKHCEEVTAQVVARR
jgi:NAD(P)H-dependent flavin oxidoreductase YrpB (nitropropane dioxygenase family)